MKTLWRVAAFACLTCTAFVRQTAATPAQDIARAVIVSGGGSSSDAFITAFGSVLARVKSSQLSDYVKAAIILRPDLQNEIVIAALNVRASSAPRKREQEVTRIVRAAVQTAAGDLAALINTLVGAFPNERGSILVAATSATATPGSALQMISLHSGVSHETGSGADAAETEHPRRTGNGDRNNDDVSPEKPPTRS